MVFLSAVIQLCWSASWEEESVWPWRALSTWDSSLLCEGKVPRLLLLYIQSVMPPRTKPYIWPSVLNMALCSRLRSCTWTSAPHWTLHGTKTAVHVRYPPTAPGSPPTQRCQTLHVSHPLLPKVLTHSTAGQHVQVSCSCMAAGNTVIYIWQKKCKKLKKLSLCILIWKDLVIRFKTSSYKQIISQ